MDNGDNSKNGYEDTIARLDKEIASNPKNADAYIRRGNLHRRKGAFESAIADFNMAIALSPHNPRTYNDRAVTYSTQGDHERAVDDFTKAIELSPQSAIYLRRGNAYMHKGDYEQAIDDFKQALQLAPGNKEAIDNLTVTAGLQATESARKQIIFDYKKQSDEQLQKYQSRVLDAKQYEERRERHAEDFRIINERISFLMKVLGGLGFLLYGAILLYHVLNMFEDWPALFPQILAVTLILFPFAWSIRVLIRDKNQAKALEEDAYTKSILTRLIDVKQDIRTEMLYKYFDHHSKFNSAFLILPSDQKNDPYTNVVQHFQNPDIKRESDRSTNRNDSDAAH